MLPKAGGGRAAAPFFLAYGPTMDEFRIIAEIFAPLATAPFAFGLTDDAAAIPPRPGFDMVVTTDTIAEGTDFFKHDPAGSIAQKALRVNLSDLAAKGAGSKYYLLNIALPEGMTREWLEAFASGLRSDQDLWGLSLIGGDTSRTEGPLTISITAFGIVPEGKMVRRAGARAGDGVYVTGTIGDSGGGLAIFKREKHALDETQRDYLIGRYRLPQPPVAFGPRLRDIASASVHVSAGLVADLGHLAKASGVRLVIDAASIPRSPALRALWGDSPEAIIRAATTGDDYQIAFTATGNSMTMATRIGRVEAGEGVALLLDGEALAMPKPGYAHF